MHQTPEFKIGDRVRCVAAECTVLETDAIYTIAEHDKDTDLEYRVYRTLEVPGWFFGSRFVLAASAPIQDKATQRKGMPLTRGLLDYFPDACLAVAECSRIANDQHNPGEEMHWNREKSTDHADCITRHLLDRGTLDDDGIRHSAKVAWRALAMLQVEIEKERA